VLTLSSRKEWKPVDIAVLSTRRKAERLLVGLFALVPAIVDAVRIPVIAAGGIADGRGAGFRCESSDDGHRILALPGSEGGSGMG
jgi:hypothetical protein